MNWEKIRKDIQEMTGKFSDKAGELFKEGTEAIKTGAEKAAAKTTYTAQIASLNWQQQGIRKKLEAEYTRLGSTVFALQKENRLKELPKQASDNFETLTALENEIAEIEAKKEELAHEYEIEKDEKESIQELTRDLQAGGGTIKQISVDANSPLVGKKLMDIRLPKEVLIATVVREGNIVIPDGKTTFKEDDKVSLIGKEEDVAKVAEELAPTPDAEEGDGAKSKPDEPVS